MSLKVILEVLIYSALAAVLESFIPNFGIIFCLLVLIMIVLLGSNPFNLQNKGNTNDLMTKATGMLLARANKSLDQANKIFNDIGEHHEEFELK